MMVLFCVFFGSVSVLMHIQMHNKDDWERDVGTWDKPDDELIARYSTPWRVFVSAFSTMMGDLQYQDFLTLDTFSTHSLTWLDDTMEVAKVFIFVAFMMFVQFILLNMLIGIMGLSIDYVKPHEESVQFKEQANMIVDFELSMDNEDKRKKEYFPRTFILSAREVKKKKKKDDEGKKKKKKAKLDVQKEIQVDDIITAIKDAKDGKFYADCKALLDARRAYKHKKQQDKKLAKLALDMKK